MSFDQQFRASIATGLTRWGYTDWNSASGTELHYHWLAEAMSGAVSRISSQDEWFVVTKVAPVLLYVSAITAGWRVIARLTGKPYHSLFAVFAVSFLLLEFDPYSIGILLGLTLAFRAIEIVCKRRSEMWQRVYLLVLVALTMMSQAPFGLVVAFVVFVTCAYRVVRFRRQRGNEFYFCLSLMITIFGIRVTLLQSGTHASAAAEVGHGRFLRFGGYDVPFGLDPMSPVWLQMANSAVALLELMVLAAPGLIGLALDKSRWHRALTSQLQVAVSVLAASIISVNLLNIGVAQGKLLSIAKVLLLPLSLTFALDQLHQFRNWWLRSAIGLVGVVIGGIYLALRNINSDPLAAGSSVAVVLFAALFVVGLVIAKSKDVLKQRSTLLAIALPVLMMGLLAGRVDEMRVYLDRPRIDEVEYLGTENVTKCFRWINENTPNSIVLATDIFDPPMLPDSGKSHLASLITKRRVWIDGIYMKQDDAELLHGKLSDSGIQKFDVPGVDYLVGSPHILDSLAPQVMANVVYRNRECSVWEVSI